MACLFVGHLVHDVSRMSVLHNPQAELEPAAAAWW